MEVRMICISMRFLSTLSLRRATTHPIGVLVTVIFLSTLSLRRATSFMLYNTSTLMISIHALLAESDRALATYWTRTGYFYPRSPCGERPSAIDDLEPSTTRISIHALLAESDRIRQRDKLQHSRFLSTLSLRRATSIGYSAVRLFIFLSTLSLRRATQGLSEKLGTVFISIHALLAESDCGLKRC